MVLAPGAAGAHFGRGCAALHTADAALHTLCVPAVLLHCVYTSRLDGLGLFYWTVIGIKLQRVLILNLAARQVGACCVAQLRL